MCLIITGPSAKIRSTLLYTKGMIADIFASNSDGLGVMYKNKRGLRVIKRLPQTLDEVTRFIDNLPQDDRALAMHWRMRTHGDIDKTNCHPYDVVPGQVAMMHNGILKTGNKADPTKSDTWHFINDFLAGPVAEHAPIIHNESFLDLLADYIGDNRFVFMDGDGRMSIVNKDSGVEAAGLWFSNTYAWSPEMLIPGYRGSSRHWDYAFHGSWRGWKDDDDLRFPPRVPTTTRLTASEVPAYVVSEFFHAVHSCEPEEAAKFLRQWPTSLIRRLMRDFKPELSGVMLRLPDDQISAAERAVLDAAFEPSYLELARLASTSPTRVAEVLCYYMNWVAVEQFSEPADVDVPVKPAEKTDDTGVHYYKDHQVMVDVDDDEHFYVYATYDENDQLVDEGYGYSSHEEALEWAQLNIDTEVTEET